MAVILPVSGTNETYTINPTKIVAVGLNYLEHVKESHVFEKEFGNKQGNADLDLPKEPVLFAKTPNVLIGPGDEIVIPRFLKSYNFDNLRIDHEAELAVIIGTGGKNIPEEEALNHVYGYTCFNDVSARNIQKSDKSGWFRGKSFDTFGPIGPVIVPAEQMKDPQTMKITARVNGKTAQDSDTSLMIFSVAKIISYISKNVSLEPGDIIATGTPSGVSPLKDGDTVEIEIEGIGILKNPVREE